MAEEDNSVRRSVRVYTALLQLYPRAFRQEYGALMTQLFRDQCRAACRNSHEWALLKLCLGTLVDLARTTFQEQLIHQVFRMKNLTTKKLSLILLAIAVGAGILSFPFISGQPGLALSLAYSAALALLLRAAVESVRPSTELVSSLVGGAAIAVIFAFIFPRWHEFHLPVVPALILVPMALNGIVPIIKSGLHVARPRS